MVLSHCKSERPSNVDAGCVRQSRTVQWGPAIWLSRTGMFTRGLLGLLLFLLIAGAAGAQHPLEPVDTSSPVPSCLI